MTQEGSKDEIENLEKENLKLKAQITDLNQLVQD